MASISQWGGIGHKYCALAPGSIQGTGEKVQGRLRQPALYGPQYPLRVNWLIEIWLLASCVKAWNGPFTYKRQPSQEGVMLLTTLPIKSQLSKGIGEGPSLLLTSTGANGESTFFLNMHLRHSRKSFTFSKHALEAWERVLHFFYNMHWRHSRGFFTFVNMHWRHRRGYLTFVNMHWGHRRGSFTFFKHAREAYESPSLFFKHALDLGFFKYNYFPFVS